MVIPERVVDLLACWIGVLGDIALLMHGGPFLYVLCGPSRERGVLWTIKRERNKRTFEGLCIRL